MLVVLAIALLAVGVATLGIGLFSNTLGWVFVSVGATALALLPLFVMYRRGRHVGWPELDGEPEFEDPSDWRAALGRRTIPEPGPGVGTGAGSGSGVGPEVAPEPEIAEQPVPAGAGGGVPAPPPAGPGDAPWRPEASSPLAGYDELRVAEILPLLTRLDATTLGEIRRREVSGRARPTILARIDELEASVSGPAAAQNVHLLEGDPDKPGGNPPLGEDQKTV